MKVPVNFFKIIFEIQISAFFVTIAAVEEDCRFYLDDVETTRIKSPGFPGKYNQNCVYEFGNGCATSWTITPKTFSQSTCSYLFYDTFEISPDYFCDNNYQFKSPIETPSKNGFIFSFHSFNPGFFDGFDIQITASTIPGMKSEGNTCNDIDECTLGTDTCSLA